MDFGIKCITVPSTKMMSGDLSRSNVFYPNVEALITNYKGKDRMVAWMDVYTEDFGSDNWFFPGWYEYVGQIPGALLARLGDGNYSLITGKTIYLSNETLDIIRKWKYDD